MRRRGSTTALAGAACIAAMVGGCSDPTVDEVDLVVHGPYVGAEADVLRQVVASFEDESGLQVRYVGSAGPGNDLLDRISSGDVPDVALLPQPALLEEASVARRLVALGPADAAVRADVGEHWRDLLVRDGQRVAAPYRFVVKSLVWFRTDVFAAEGYRVPVTLDGLWRLVDRMIADGHTPWCSGMDDAGATGWWATDWVEDLVLRGAGRESYRAWASLRVPFDDPAVVDALQRFEEVVDTTGAVDGGRRAVLNTPVSRAMDPMLLDEPGCLMHKQASFQTAWLPDGTEVGGDRLDVFALPSADGTPAPLVISGEIAAVLTDAPAARALVEHLTSTVGAAPWRDVGGSLVVTSDLGGTTDAVDERLLGLLRAAPTIVYDASDVMPPRIGTDAFFRRMQQLVAGTPAVDVAARLQQDVEEWSSRDG